MGYVYAGLSTRPILMEHCESLGLVLVTSTPMELLGDRFPGSYLNVIASGQRLFSDIAFDWFTAEGLYSWQSLHTYSLGGGTNA